jgi:hypothetical protein
VLDTIMEFGMKKDRVNVRLVFEEILITNKTEVHLNLLLHKYVHKGSIKQQHCAAAALISDE